MVLADRGNPRRKNYCFSKIVRRLVDRFAYVYSHPARVGSSGCLSHCAAKERCTAIAHCAARRALEKAIMKLSPSA
jgi:hypothetical protein